MTLRRPLTIWLISAGLGAGAAVLAALIGVFGIFFVLLIIPGIGGRTWLAATSGALIGFGATTLALLLTRPAAAGGAGGEGTLLMFVAVVPLLIGLVLGVLTLLTARSRPS